MEVPVVEEGTLNVLILGADDAASLVDTIIVVNVNVKTKEIKLISIPRMHTFHMTTPSEE